YNLLKQDKHIAFVSTGAVIARALVEKAFKLSKPDNSPIKLEYRDINGIIQIFYKWCEAKKYTNELAKGTINYRKQSIDQHLTHHEHKAEAEARKSY
ncbi:4543_t:CDS:2, partial [Funneliformis geosporum]